LASKLESLDDMKNIDKSFSGTFSVNDRTKNSDLNHGDDKQRHRINVNKGEILFIESDKYFDAFISIYINSGRQFPKPNQLIFCHERTQWQDI
jgi:hypothetical protein